MLKFIALGPVMDLGIIVEELGSGGKGGRVQVRTDQVARKAAIHAGAELDPCLG